MELNIIFFYYFSLLCFGINATKISYWPPSIDVPLETSVITLLKKGCEASVINSDDPQLITVVTQTASGSTTTPAKFLQIPSGKLIEPNLDCDQCDIQNFTLNGNNYNFNEFNCKTLCIFTAVKNDYGDCRRGENFNIGIVIKNDFIKLMEDCHNYEKSNLTYMRNTAYKKLGQYSRKVLDGNEECRQQCMPVCMQPLKINSSNNNSVFTNSEFERNLLYNLCMVKRDESSMYWLKVKQDVCSGSTSINFMKFTLTSVLFLVIIKNIIK